MTMRRVVITGLGALTPIGNNLESYWTNLQAGKSGAGPITQFDSTHFRTKFACEVKDYNPLDHFHRKEARKLDRFVQYALVATDEAMQDSQLLSDSLDHNRVGVIWSSGIGGLKVFQDEIENFASNDGVPRFNPFFIPKMIANMASGHISIKYGFRGISFAPVSACASSTHALMDAFNYIRLGKAEAIITGGSEAGVTPAGIGGFNAMKALSENNEAPEQASRPFDQNRDGFVLGEGAGAIILEELEHAKARGAKIYAELVGTGASSDGYHITATHPEGLGAILAMTSALEDGNYKIEDVDYLNAHATSTPVGDVSEVKAIEKLFESNLENLQVSATKSMTGHLLGAAGAIEGIACIMALHNGVIPPTINLDKVDENINPTMNLTPNVAVKKEIKLAMCNTFGFGGHNATSLFKKYEE
ncbi:MAG: beta-ketoacyl-ACP synthase II [Bacteroidota bacterium]